MNGKWLVIVLWIASGCVVSNQPNFDTIKLSMLKIKETKPKHIANSTVLQETSKLVTSETNRVVKQPSLPSTASVETITTSTVAKNTITKNPRKTPEILKIEEIPRKIVEKVRLKKGEYYLDKAVEITSKGALWIDPGTVIEFEECGIVCQGEIHAKGTAKKPIIFRGAEEWENITIWGENAMGEFRHCSFSDGYGRQVKIAKTGKLQLKDSVGIDSFGGALLYANKSTGRVENCDFRKNYGKGAMALLSVKKVVVANNDIVENDGEGIYCFDGAVDIHGNNVNGNKLTGILCAGKGKALVNNNSCENNNTGIEIINQAAPLIIKNKCHGNEQGILARDEASPKIKKNEIMRNNKVGIGCYGKSSGLIEYNVCEGGIIGIVTSDTSQPKIYNNTCNRQGKACIAVLALSSAKIENNILRDCSTGILIQTSAKPKLKSNSIEDCSKKIYEFTLR